MSDRTSIAVYARGECLDFRIYEDFAPAELFCEAAALWALYGTCGSRSAYLRARYGTENAPCKIEEDLLRELEACSDFPLILDLSTRCLYLGTRPKAELELQELPRLTAAETAFGNLDELLYTRRLDFSRGDPQTICQALRALPGADLHLSGETWRKLIKLDE